VFTRGNRQRHARDSGVIAPGMTDSAPSDTLVAEEIAAGVAVRGDSLVPSSVISIEEFLTPFTVLRCDKRGEKHADGPNR
jgi:hypothetical protein